MRLTIFVGFVLVGLLLLSRPTDSDLFWHLRLGQIILEQGRLPYFDEFSWTFTGYPWANSYWLSDVLIYAGYKFLGILPLTFLFASIGSLAYVLVSFFAQRERHIGVFLLVTVLSGSLAIDFVRIRGQAFSILFLSLLIIFLFKKLYRRRPFLFGLPVFFALWANIHSGFLTGLLFLAFYLILELLIRLAQKDRRGARELTLVFGFFVLSLAATLANPYGFSLWRTLFADVSSGSMWGSIIAWQPTFYFTKPSILLVSTVIIALLSLHGNFPKIPLSLSVSALISLFMAINSFFFLPIWGLFFGYLVSAHPPQLFHISKIKKLLLPYIVISSVLLAIALLSNISAVVRSAGDTRQAERAHGYPVDALVFLQSQDAEKIFNEYSWGGYMIWYAPDLETFVDGRMPGWSRGKQRIFADYLEIFKAGSNAEKLLADYGVEWVLIGKGTRLEEKVLTNGKWQKKFEDQNSLVFRKI